MMKHMQKAGGIAALIEAATFVFGFVVFFTALAAGDYGSLAVDPVQNAAFLVHNQGLLYAFYLVIYVVFGAFLVVLALALFERLKAGATAMVQVATAFGLLWAGLVIASGMVANVGAGVVAALYPVDPAQAASTWLALHLVIHGLGGGNEIVGALWILLLSWAGLLGGGLPRALNVLGIAVGAAGLLTMVPALAPVGAVFGLGSIAWFVWVGIVMLRDGTPVADAVDPEAQPALRASARS
jgi:hypothetical protein